MVKRYLLLSSDELQILELEDNQNVSDVARMLGENVRFRPTTQESKKRLLTGWGLTGIELLGVNAEENVCWDLGTEIGIGSFYYQYLLIEIQK